jgi:hypothetical protein
MLLSLYKKSTSWFYQFINTQNDKENMNRTTSRRIHRAQAMRAHTHWNGINLVQANKTRDLPRYGLNLKKIPAVCRPCRFRAFAVCCSRSHVLLLPAAAMEESWGTPLPASSCRLSIVIRRRAAAALQQQWHIGTVAPASNRKATPGLLPPVLPPGAAVLALRISHPFRNPCRSGN